MQQLMDIQKQPPRQERTAVMPKKQNKLPLRLTRFTMVTTAIVLLVALSSILVYKYVQANHQIQQLRNNPQQIVASSTQKLLNQVGRLALLPRQSLAPTVAIVKNVDQLKGQAFFVDAQNGDYLIVYAQAKKAILYRPSDNRIIEYASTS